jgi:hypothetical protein
VKERIVRTPTVVMFQREEKGNRPLSGFEDTAWGVELLFFSRRPEGDQLTPARLRRGEKAVSYSGKKNGERV